MDDIVLRGMAKWPNVPAVYGWLALDRRGNWLLKGEKISNATVLAFIGRNYARDDAGRWYFQNGPQRVYVDLEYTPFVYRALGAGQRGITVETSSGMRVTDVRGAWMDEEGALLIDTALGIGVVDDRDLDVALAALAESGGGTPDEDTLVRSIEGLQAGMDAPLVLRANGAAVALRSIRSTEVPTRFHFVQRAGEKVDEVGANRSMTKS